MADKGNKWYKHRRSLNLRKGGRLIEKIINCINDPYVHVDNDCYSCLG